LIVRAINPFLSNKPTVGLFMASIIFCHTNVNMAGGILRALGVKKPGYNGAAKLRHYIQALLSKAWAWEVRIHPPSYL
jgi:hypothetical protein